MRTSVWSLAAALAVLATAPIPQAHAGTEPPVRLEQAKLLASLGAAGDHLGNAVAVSGGIVVVGAFLDDVNGADSGSAWIYRRPSGGWDGTLVEVARLVPSGAGGGDFFGRSVAIDGDVVVVGAHGGEAAYVFVEPPGGWSGPVVQESARLLASDGAGDDLFGEAVAISGGTIVVGADYADPNGAESGAAYVFTEPPGGWSGTLEEDAKLVPSDGASDDNFGLSVAVSGATVVVGAPYHGAGGAAYVFREPAGGWAGTLAESARLVKSQPEAGDSFGNSVGVSGSHAVVGAHHADGPGRAYVYTEPAGGWAGTLIEGAKLHCVDTTAGDQVGWSVAISGSRVVAGAYARNEGASDTGAACLFHRPGGGWSDVVVETAKLLATDRAANDWLGLAVAIDRDTVVAGAPRDDDDGDDSGSAYVFDFVLFTDGFENGDTAAWSSTAP